MTYQVIARKWRPQSFADLVGQDHISQTLVNALKNNRLPQALLFTGQRGTGKTSSARILAKALRCPNAKEFIACHTCNECLDIAAGRSLNVIEIDGASNNGVDAVRELCESVMYKPSSGFYKIYVIDEVHMLSTSAFNALLKTIEEPPDHVIFILATTEVQKIPATILSRTQRFDFRRIATREIVKQLELICKTEKISFDLEALWLIARQSDGSMRDGQSLLDQVITFSDGHLSQDKIIHMLGLTDRTLLLKTLTSLTQRDQKLMMAVIDEVFHAGYDAKLFSQDLLDSLRNLLMVKILDEQSSRSVDLADTEISELQSLGTNLSEEEIHYLFDMGLKGAEDITRAFNPQIVLEMLLLRMVEAPRITSLNEFFNNSTANQKPPSFDKTKQTPPQAKPITTNLPQTNSSNMSQKSSAKIEIDKTNEASDEEFGRWIQFVKKIKEIDALFGTKLETLKVIKVEEQFIELALSKTHKFLADDIINTEFQQKLSQHLKKHWHPKIQFKIKPEQHIEDEHANSIKSFEENQSLEKKKKIYNEINQNPFVQSAKSLFKGEIKLIKE